MINGIRNFKRGLLIGSACAALLACQALSPEPAQAVYAAPEQAVVALVNASRTDDKAALLKILGPAGEKLIYSGDPVADHEAQQKFVAAYDAAHRLDSEGADKDILIVGDEDWPMPIPLAHGEAGWFFDTEAGAQAVLDRRIGRNELNVIEICRDYVAAQREYAAYSKKLRGYAAYAQHITSRPGTHDGLYWPTSAGETPSPFGPLIAAAQAEGYRKIEGRHAPFHGYYFRVLKQQGPGAAGGGRDYIVNGHMTRGFALIAYPAAYADSGVKSFIVNQNGIVYEKDLGPETATVVAQIRAYDPGEGWAIVR